MQVRIALVLTASTLFVNWATCAADPPPRPDHDLPQALQGLARYPEELESLRRFKDTESVVQLVAESRAAIARHVEEAFGTADAPRVPPELNLDLGKADRDMNRDAGWKHALGRAIYREKCAECHGENGAGDGLKAAGLDPAPRDFRLATLKWTSTHPARKARLDDIERTVRAGVPGTAMPAWSGLNADEISGVSTYVAWLMLRSWYERRVSFEMLYPVLIGSEPTEAIRDLSVNYASLKEDAVIELESAVRHWNESQLDESWIIPRTPRTPDTTESRTRGRELYLSAKSRCYICHGESGRGDGKQTAIVQRNPYGKPQPEPGLYDDWGHRCPPPDFTSPMFRYRGGSRDVDLFQRIMIGIKGAPHPPYSPTLTEEEAWDIINYVDSLRSAPRTEGKTD